MTLLSSSNRALADSLQATLAAVAHLDAINVVVHSVSIERRKPVLRIDGPQGPFLQGALKSRMTFNGMHRCVMVATVHGCQVEWTETYPVAREAQRNG